MEIKSLHVLIDELFDRRSNTSLDFKTWEQDIKFNEKIQILKMESGLLLIGKESMRTMEISFQSQRSEKELFVKATINLNESLNVLDAYKQYYESTESELYRYC